MNSMRSWVQKKVKKKEKRLVMFKEKWYKDFQNIWRMKSDFKKMLTNDVDRYEKDGKSILRIYIECNIILQLIFYKIFGNKYLFD